MDITELDVYEQSHVDPQLKNWLVCDYLQTLCAFRIYLLCFDMEKSCA